MNPDVYDMTKSHLMREGFDGLYDEGWECACEIADLAPCGEMRASCIAGYRYWCEDADCEHTATNGKHWHMRSRK